MEWIKVSTLDDIPRLGARTINTAQGGIAIFRTAANEVFALLDRCPHKGGPLSQGIVYDRRVACPLHNWVIALDSGKATGPDQGCTKSFPAKIENGVVYLALTPTDPAVQRCAERAEIRP